MTPTHILLFILFLALVAVAVLYPFTPQQGHTVTKGGKLTDNLMEMNNVR